MHHPPPFIPSALLSISHAQHVHHDDGMPIAQTSIVRITEANINDVFRMLL